MVIKPNGHGTHEQKGRVVVCENVQQVLPGKASNGLFLTQPLADAFRNHHHPRPCSVSSASSGPARPIGQQPGWTAEGLLNMTRDNASVEIFKDCANNCSYFWGKGH